MPDLTAVRIEELEGLPRGLLLEARAALGVPSSGPAVVEIAPGADPHPGHDHPGVGPEPQRTSTPGPGGIRRLAMGGTPGEAHEAPGSCELGAPDPPG